MTDLEKMEVTRVYYEMLRKPYDDRINQLWRARYSSWALLAAIGAKVVAFNGKAPSLGVAIAMTIVILGIVLVHRRYETAQEDQLGQARHDVYGCLAVAQGDVSRLIDEFKPKKDLHVWTELGGSGFLALRLINCSL